MTLPNTAQPKKRKPAKAKTGSGNSSSPVITVKIGKALWKLSHREIRSPQLAEEIREAQRREGDVPVRITIEKRLLTVGDTKRLRLLSFLVGLSNAQIKLGKCTSYHRDVLSAVLSLIHNDMSLQQRTRARLAALEAAVLLYADGLELACDSIATVFKANGVKGVTARDLLRDARRISGRIGRGHADASSVSRPTVKSALIDAPVDGSDVVPPGWKMDAAGITCTYEDDAAGHIPAPIVIVRRYRDVSRDVELVEIAWRRDGNWQRTIEDRDIIANCRSIVSLAAKGMPVTSNTASMLVQFLADYEDANIERLKMSTVVGQMGWHTAAGQQVFLLGRNVVTGNKMMPAGHDGAASNMESSFAPIVFHGADAGDEQICRGFHEAGTYEGWCAAIEPIADYPLVQLAGYASLAAPLLNILGTPNFVLDFAGPTTGGKTTTLRYAASFFGCPDERATCGAAIFTWHSTRVWLERAPGLLTGLPFVVDEHKHVPKREDVAKTIYAVVQGCAKGRGSVKGIAPAQSWQTVMLTSGEQPITSFTEDGGTRARVLQSWGSPFIATDAATGELVRRLNQGLQRHYGHAGLRFVQAVLLNKRRWTEWRELYRRRIKFYAELAGDNAVAGRMAESFAAIWLAAKLAHEFIDLPWKFSDPISRLYAELTAETGDADRGKAALRVAVEWATAHQADFDGRVPGDGSRIPHQGFAGRWDIDRRQTNPDGKTRVVRRWQYIGYVPLKLHEILRTAGFEPEAIIKTWNDKGWLRTTRESASVTRIKARVRVDDECMWVYAIRRSAIEQALHLDFNR